LIGKILVNQLSNPRLRTASRLRTVILLAGALMAASVALPAQVSLATVVDLAQHKSSSVLIADAEVRKAQALLSQSKDVFVPSLVFGSGMPAFPEEGFTGSPPTLWSATVQSLVFSIPQKHYMDSSRAGLQAAISSLKDAREQTALDASIAYIELDAVNQDLQAAQQQEAFAARLVAVEQERSEAGVDPLTDLLDARLSAANLRLRKVHLETRASVLSKQLSVLTGLPDRSISIDHASIPEIPQLHGDLSPRSLHSVDAAHLQARSRLSLAKGDEDVNLFPQLSFFAQYNRNTTLLNNVNHYFANALPANNLSSGFSIQVPLFDMGHRSKAHESAADALRATVEADQARLQNELQITQINGSLRELDAQAEIASLKQQIAGEQLKTVITELEVGNGSANPQLSPKAEQLARIDERQKYEDAVDAGFDLAKARLELLRALGHMQDWLDELQKRPVN
jgi:outer membrane protein TolC